MEYRIGPWRFVWDGVPIARLADVWHDEVAYPVDCKQVGEYSFGWNRDELYARREAMDAEAALQEAAEEWIANSAPDYTRELPYLR